MPARAVRVFALIQRWLCGRGRLAAPLLCAAGFRSELNEQHRGEGSILWAWDVMES